MANEDLYSFLVMFSKGNIVCRKFLIDRFGEEKFNRALNEGLIVEVGRTDIGDPQYAITELGRKNYY